MSLTVDDLIAIEEIKRLKYKYVRCLDQKRWDDIAECSGLPIPLFPFVRGRAKSGGPAIWQPLFLGHRERFRSSVHESAGEEHALSTFLAKRWGPADAS